MSLHKNYRKATIKFYDPQLRFDPQYVQTQAELILKDNGFQYYKFYNDHEAHIGYHINLVIKSKSYKELAIKYSNKDTKITPGYLWIGEFITMDSFIDWCSYIGMRNEVNYKRAIPHRLPPCCIESPVPPSTPRSTNSIENSRYQF